MNVTTPADVSGADVSGADVSGADVSGADVSGADMSGADVSGDDNGNHTYQFPNPLIHTPHPITGVIYTDINPQRTKVCCYTCI